MRYSEAAFAVAAAELERARNDRAQKSRRRDPAGNSEAAAGQACAIELQIERSKLEMRVAKMNADVHQAAVKSADNAVTRRQIVSPLGGVVVTMFHEKGEWVAAGEQVLQVIRIDRLRVEGFLNATEVGPEGSRRSAGDGRGCSRPAAARPALPARSCSSVRWCRPAINTGCGRKSKTAPKTAARCCGRA